jgi:hypothetical protein
MDSKEEKERKDARTSKALCGRRMESCEKKNCKKRSVKA